MTFKNVTLFGENISLPQLVEYYAVETPHAIALISENQQLTYSELDEQSSILSVYLQSIGVQRNDFVAIHMARSTTLIIAILAVQKAGGAYVPIDIAYPKDRIAFMVTDAQAKVVLTETAYQHNIPNENTKLVCLDKEWTDSQQTTKRDNIPEVKATDLAYMIYTSGSTGKPKGVMISHQNVLNQLEGQQHIAPNRIKKMLLTCSISFDVSVLTIYWTFYQGAILVLPKQDEEKDIAQLADTLSLIHI